MLIIMYSNLKHKVCHQILNMVYGLERGCLERGIKESSVSSWPRKLYESITNWTTVDSNLKHVNSLLMIVDINLS